jgi:hypothetical protein
VLTSNDERDSERVKMIRFKYSKIIELEFSTMWMKMACKLTKWMEHATKSQAEYSKSAGLSCT